jgi:type I restriction enzyme S subunit
LSWQQLGYEGGKIKNLHYGLIHKGLPTMVDISKEPLPFVKGEAPCNYTICKDGDIAFADASEDTNDVAKAIEFINCNNEDVICGLHSIHGRDKINSTVVGYKGYAFASFAFHKQIRRITQGTKVYSISIKNFNETYIGVPSIEEQTKIARLLFLIDERISTQNKIIEKLQSLIKGLSQSLLSTKQGWVAYRLDDLVQIKSGYSRTQVCFKTPYLVSRIETISKHCIDMSRVGYVQNIPKSYKLNIGDILFSNINSVQYIGNTAYLDKEYGLYHGMNLLRLIPNSTLIIPRFLHLLLCTDKIINYFQTICNKAVSQASINQSALGKTVLFIPSIAVQQDVCDTFESVENKLKLEFTLYKNLLLQKQYFLQQMFI